jgi:hypothetical protein
LAILPSRPLTDGKNSKLKQTQSGRIGLFFKQRIREERLDRKLPERYRLGRGAETRGEWKEVAINGRKATDVARRSLTDLSSAPGNAARQH